MEVKPGVTGWAQINGRNTLTWEEKFALDVWYVDHRSFWLDMQIVVKTFFKVLSRSDVSSERDNTSAKEFTGSTKPN
jgi:sugar transferase EpsL